MCVCVPGRWRASVTRQPALPPGYFEGFQGIVSYPVGFSLHKDKVRVGRLHDGVVLHHTVDTWTPRTGFLDNDNRLLDKPSLNKQNPPDFLKSFAKT